MPDTEQAAEEALQLLGLAKKHGIPLSLGIVILIGVVSGAVWGANMTNRVKSVEKEIPPIKEALEEIKKGETLWQKQQNKSNERTEQALRAIQFRLGIPLPAPHPHSSRRGANPSSEREPLVEGDTN